MTTTSIMKKLSQAKKKPYPPVLFKCRLEEELKSKMGADYSIEAVATYVGVTTLTIRNIYAGYSVKLENAMALAELVAQPIPEVWELKRR